MGGKPLQYLDRLPMYCHADEAIRDFKINYCGGNNMKYTATCVKVTAQGVTTHKSGCHQVQGRTSHGSTVRPSSAPATLPCRVSTSTAVAAPAARCSTTTSACPCARSKGRLKTLLRTPC